MSNIYQITNLNWKIKDKKILDDVSITFNEGLNIIVGESGAGKSSILNMLGLIDFPSSGSINYNDVSILDKSLAQIEAFRSKKIGFVFQNNNLIADMSVRENLQLAMEINSINKKNYNDVLSKLNIEEYIDKKVAFLSGGEQQRVAIARALLKESDIIIADEPTGNLDNKNASIVFETLKECAHKYGKIVIVVTHDQNLANKYSDTLVELEEGKVKKVSIINSVEAVTETKENIEISSKKEKLSLKTKFNFAFNYFKRKPKRAVCISLITSVTIVCGALVMFINGQTNKMLKDMNTNYLETDYMYIEKHINGQRHMDYCEFGTILWQDEIKEIKESDLFNVVTEYVNMSFEIGKEEESERIDVKELKNTRFIEINDFFQNRIMSNDINGTFPSSEKDIILGKDIADELFSDEDPIGKKIKLWYGNNSITLNVVGVNNTVAVTGEYWTYIPSKVTFDIEIDLPEYAMFNLKEKLETISTPGVNSLGGCTGSYGYRNNFKLLEGRYPENKDEIAIDVKVNKILAEECSKKSLLNDEIYVSLVEAGLYKVVGIYDSDIETQMVAFHESNKEKLLKRNATRVDAYLKDEVSIEDFEKTAISRRYSCMIMYKHLQGSVADKTRIIRNALLFISTIFAIIAFGIINMFVGMSIKERTYEIGIIRALGGSKKDIKDIYFLECAIHGIFAVCIGIVIFQIGKIFVLNTVIENSTFSIGLIDVIVCGMCLLLIIIAGVLPIRKINKMKPIECIRNVAN